MTPRHLAITAAIQRQAKIHGYHLTDEEAADCAAQVAMPDADPLFTLFDAMHAAQCGNGSLSLHDYTGDIVKSLREWATDRGLDARTSTLELDRGDGHDYAWDKTEVSGMWGSIVVHDTTSRRPITVKAAEGDWSPAQHVRAS